MHITPQISAFRNRSRAMQQFVRWTGRPLYPKHLAFREVLPMALKNSVSGRSEVDTGLLLLLFFISSHFLCTFTGAVCLHELTMFLVCLKAAEFDDTQCRAEHTNFTECFAAETARRSATRKAAREGLLGVGMFYLLFTLLYGYPHCRLRLGGERKMTAAQVNKLMEMWPQEGMQTRKHHKRRIPSMSYANPYFLEPRDHY
jgi:hypothetical protein